MFQRKCVISLQLLVKLGLQLSQVFGAMILHIIYISDIHSGNTSFFTLSQTWRWIFTAYLTCMRCCHILRNHLRKVTGRLSDTRSNHFNESLLINSETGLIRCKAKQVEYWQKKRWDVRLYVFRLLKLHRAFHDSCSSQPSLKQRFPEKKQIQP